VFGGNPDLVGFRASFETTEDTINGMSIKLLPKFRRDSDMTARAKNTESRYVWFVAMENLIGGDF
jgi:hypothetical protein